VGDVPGGLRIGEMLCTGAEPAWTEGRGEEEDIPVDTGDKKEAKRKNSGWGWNQ